MSAYLLVHEDRIYSIVDQMRVAVPEEIKRANRIESEKDRILAQAKEESTRIRELAKQEAEELISRDTVTSSSQQRADNIIERARREAESLRLDADAYVVEVLAKLEDDLQRTLAVVRNGMESVDGETAVSEEDSA
jgi:cell division septum initiation protein DivIVA